METGSMGQITNRRVFVALPNGCAVTEIDTLKLLSEAEIDLSSTQFVRGESDLTDMSSNDALVVVLMDNQPTDDSIATATLSAARAGLCNIVGVWAPGQVETGIHPSMLQFGTAQVPWEPERLKNELGSDCENAFQNADGETADANEIEPHECE
jgi:hypothetical protein